MEKLDLLAKKHPDQITRKDAHNFTVPQAVCISQGTIQRRASQSCQ